MSLVNFGTGKGGNLHADTDQSGDVSASTDIHESREKGCEIASCGDGVGSDVEHELNVDEAVIPLVVLKELDVKVTNPAEMKTRPARVALEPSLSSIISMIYTRGSGQLNVPHCRIVLTLTTSQTCSPN
jgi:hypothetical protein